MTLPYHIKAFALKKPFKQKARSIEILPSKEEELPDPPAVIAATGFAYADEPVEIIRRHKVPIGFRFRRRGCGFTIAMDDSYDTRCFTSHKFTPDGGFFQVNMTPEDYKYALKVAEIELSPDDLTSLAAKLKTIDENWLRDMFESVPLTIKPLGPQTTSFEFAENGREYTITTFAGGASRAPSFIMNYYCDRGHETPRTLTLHEQERAINQLSSLMTIDQSIQYTGFIQLLREHIINAKAKIATPAAKKFTISPTKPEGICFELTDSDVSYTLTAFHPAIGRKPSFVMTYLDNTGNKLPKPLSNGEKHQAIDAIIRAMTASQCIQYALSLNTLRDAVYAANDPPPAQDTGRFAPARSINFFG